DGVNGDLRRIRHRLLAVGAQQAHHHVVRANIESEDRHEEHPRMLRGQPAHADVAEDAHQAHLAVLSNECVIAQRTQPDLPAHLVTILTMRSGTTITLAGFAPSSAACTFGLARAARCTSASGRPAAMGIRSRTLPSTWTTIVTSRGAATVSSYAGQRCW